MLSQTLKNLQEKGFKITKVRVTLLDIFQQTSTPLSIGDILLRLKQKKLNPNKTTVYREVEFLKDLEVLQEVDFGEGKKRYEISQKHHHHIMCINCKTIEDVSEDQDIDSIGKKVAKKLGFKPIGHSLEFFGLCSKCQ